MSNFDIKEISRPHLVILGAGTSRAACPKGDKNGKILPIMNDLPKVLELETLLNHWELDSNKNFEKIYSDLFNRNEMQKCKELQNHIMDYFNKLTLPTFPTIYDHLILSLKETDCIATFNWDPFLIQALHRNQNSGLKFPKLLFLHGSVSIGFCSRDKIATLRDKYCRKCGTKVTNSSLLYPIENKNYAQDVLISSTWVEFEEALSQAWSLTIFGYSAPKSDEEVIKRMKSAWGDLDKRDLEQVAFITKDSEEKTLSKWGKFIHPNHYDFHNDFYNSRIANYPRFSNEAMFSQFFLNEIYDPTPIPRNLDFHKLWDWINKTQISL